MVIRVSLRGESCASYSIKLAAGYDSSAMSSNNFPRRVVRILTLCILVVGVDPGICTEYPQRDWWGRVRGAATRRHYPVRHSPGRLEPYAQGGDGREHCAC